MNTIGQSATLFRPVPPSTLQSNLAQHYQRTSEFVRDSFSQFREGEAASGAPDSTTDSRPGESRRSESDDRIRPYGMGTNVDLYA